MIEGVPEEDNPFASRVFVEYSGDAWSADQPDTGAEMYVPDHQPQPEENREA